MCLIVIDSDYCLYLDGKLNKVEVDILRSLFLIVYSN